MKIKKIKSIIIGDTKFKIIWDYKGFGGEFSYPDEEGNEAFIRISCVDEKINPIGVLNIIIHELKEIIQVEQRVRYGRPDEYKAYEFHYTHREHTDLCARLAGILSQFYY